MPVCFLAEKLAVENEMLDLNIDAVFSGGFAACDRGKTVTDDSVTSTTTSTTNNTAPADETDCYSSTVKNSPSTFNFSILNKNVIEIEDDVNDGMTNNINELQLFPMGEHPPPTESELKAKYWLNLSAPDVAANGGGVESGMYKAQVPVSNQVQQPQVKKSRRGPRSRSSQYRGVTFYRRTGRWESHIWDCGKQVYLGGFDTAHAAARAYDRAAIKFRGVDADINFTIGDYDEDMKQTKNLTKEEFVHILRRQSTGFSRGSSKFRGVTLHKCGRWEARMGQFLGKKAYDKAAIQCNGREAVTNFEPSNYDKEMNTIARSDGGSGSSLDLNLGMSLSLDGRKGKDTTRNLLFPRASGELPDSKRLKFETTSPPQELIMPTRFTSMWAGVYSGFNPNTKERATKTSSEVVPLPGYSNWSYKLPSQGVVNPVQVFSSSAASSGFSPATSPYLNSLVSITTRPQFPAAAAFNRLP